MIFCRAENTDYISPGLIIQGPCTCLAGDACTLTIQASVTEYWDTGNKMEQELLVFFEGPARAIARLEPDHQSSAFAAWRAHYQIWDPGSYKAFVQAGCTAQGNSVILAEFTVTIVGFEGLNQRLTPCDFGHQGRWLLEQAKEDYYWTPYACAPPLASAESFSSGVRKRGFRRITFIGDSHQRMLYMHLKFLLNGLSIDSDYDRHVDMSSVVFRGKIDRELQLRFFWVDG